MVSIFPLPHLPRQIIDSRWIIDEQLLTMDRFFGLVTNNSNSDSIKEDEGLAVGRLK